MKTKAEIDAMFSGAAEDALRRAERDGVRYISRTDASPDGRVELSLEIWQGGTRLQLYSTKLQRDKSGALQRAQRPGAA